MIPASWLVTSTMQYRNFQYAALSAPSSRRCSRNSASAHLLAHVDADDADVFTLRPWSYPRAGSRRASPQRSLQPDYSASWELAQQGMKPPSVMGTDSDVSASNGAPVGNPMSPIAMDGSGVHGGSPAQAWGQDGTVNGYMNGYANGSGQSQAQMYSPEAQSLNGVGSQMYNGNMPQPLSGYSPSPNQHHQQQPPPQLSRPGVAPPEQCQTTSPTRPSPPLGVCV